MRNIAAKFVGIAAVAGVAVEPSAVLATVVAGFAPVLVASSA